MAEYRILAPYIWEGHAVLRFFTENEWEAFLVPGAGKSANRLRRYALSYAREVEECQCWIPESLLSYAGITGKLCIYSDEDGQYFLCAGNIEPQ